jgi:hypothetical protein
MSRSMRPPTATVLVAATFGLMLSSASAQSPLFAELREAIPPGLIPLAYGDVNGDGAEDLVTTTGVALNMGGGRFLPPAAPLPLPPYSAGFTGPEVAGAGDFDGDGDIDVFVHPRGSGPNPWLPAVLENLGGGVLALSAVPFPAVTTPSSCDYSLNPPVVADFDADGRADIVLSRQELQCAGTLYLWKGQPGLAFTSTILPNGAAATSRGRAIAANDYDGDGDVDLFAMGFVAASIDGFSGAVVLVNDGLGNLTSGFTTLSLPGLGSSYYHAVFADLDGDGVRDIATLGRFIVSGFGPTLRLSFYRGLGGLSFAPPVHGPTLSENYYARVWALDANGDGTADAAVYSPPGTFGSVQPSAVPLLVYSATSAGFGAAPIAAVPFMTPYFFPSGDADGDGTPDFMYRERTGLVRILFSQAGGAPSAPPGSPQLYFPVGSRLQTVDVDGDGDRDVVDPLPTGSSSFGWLEALNDGFGNFTTGVLRTGTGSGPGRVAFVDWDGDGDRDAFVGETPGTPSRVHLVDGSPTLTSSTVGPFGSEVVGIAVVDWDGDGDEDLLTAARTPAGASARSLATYENLGGGVWIGPTVVDAGHTTRALVVGDFDGDGDTDAVTVNQSLGGAADYCRLALRTAGGWSVSTLAPNVSGTRGAAGDLDGDGDLDLVIPPATLLNDGTGSFVLGPTVASAPPVSAPPLALADLNGDGLLDLCESAYYRLGVGGGAFGPAINYAPYLGGLQLTYLAYDGVADLDGDADPDLAMLDGRILTNVGRQLVHGAWAVPGGTATLELYGPPGAPVDLFVATQLAPTPFDLPGFGLVRIDPTAALYVGPNVLDAAGRAAYPVSIPNVPGLVGFALYWQAAMPSIPALTGAEATVILAQ